MNFMSLLRRSVVGAFVLLASSLALPTAGHADILTFTSCHVVGGCGTATDFGTVTLTQSGTSVLFDVGLNSGNGFVEGQTAGGVGSGPFFLFNDSLPGSTITGITATLNGAIISVLGGLTGFTNQSPIDTITAGTFSASIQCLDQLRCSGPFTPDFDGLHFTVTNATLAQLETAANVFGNIFVANILCGQLGCTGSTGPVDVTVVVSGVPGPIAGAGLPGLIMAFGGLLGLVRRRRNALRLLN